MKKKIFTLLALLASVLGVSAANEVTVSEALIPAGKSGSFSVELSNPGDAFMAYQMKIKLPDGITFKKIEANSSRYTDHSIGSAVSGNIVTITCIDVTGDFGELILGESGSLFTISVEDASGKAAGTKLSAQILDEGTEFTRKDESSYKPGAVDFDIEITDKVILDENSTALPATQAGVDVLVKRTIKKDVWNTICLPFGMEASQVKQAFGDDVKIGKIGGFTKKSATEFTINFTEYDYVGEDWFDANVPYIVKTTKDITSFEVTGVVVEPNVASAKTEVKSKGKSTIYYGTLFAGNIVPKDNFFLSGNKFYYSTGATSIKGFRGYFYIQEFDSSAGAPEIVFEVGGETTKIDGLNVIFDDGQYYNLKGQKVDNPTEKGVYIKNGKKVVIK